MTYKELAKPIKTGTLRKQGGAWKSWNARFCALAKDALYYFKQSPPADGDVRHASLPWPLACCCPLV